MKTCLILLALVWLALSPWAGRANAACVLTKIADLPVTMKDFRPMAPVKVNGHDALFFIDSGAFFSSVTPEGAATFGLTKGPLPPGLTIRGVGGTADMSLVTAKDFFFANIPYRHVDFLVGEKGDGSGAVGLIGQNLIGQMDVEYDLANGVIRLFVPKGCDGARLAYWVSGQQAYFVIHISPATDTLSNATAMASVNGVKIRAEFDTGSPTSMLSLDTAARAGVKPPQAINDPGQFTSGIGLRTYLRTWIAPVDSFNLGDEEIRHTRLRFGEMSLPGDVDMLIGADFFLSHRVFVSNSQHQPYFTYNGGPVFNLTAHPPGAAYAPTDGPASDSYSDAPTDAAGYARRAAANRNRRDVARAVTDLTRAIELDPKQPDYFRERGEDELADGETDAALADFDQALKLKPDDLEVFLARARYYQALGDKARVRDDLGAIDHAAAVDADVRLALSGFFASADLYVEAITQADAWMIAHPKNDRLAEALNDRCWYRVMSNRDLDKALADCNAALKLRPGSPIYLDSRGLFRLRRGEFDKAIADFQAVQRLTPDNPWMLYGKGLAELKKGLKSEGEADIKAATVIDPKLADKAKVVGLAR